MDKRYQVFVSSTYEDLQEERKEVMQALLELDCIPAGMELFPASNDDQWTLIRRVIDDSDYYIVIVGGRYGSTNTDGISYTEMEYRYALETGKPIMGFLHKNPQEIKSGFTETTDDGKKKLDSFIGLVKKKVVKCWTNPNDLGSVVSRSMINLIKQVPSIGWVKADKAIDDSSAKEILRLQKENEILREQIEQTTTMAPKGSETLSQGTDEVQIKIRIDATLSTKPYDDIVISETLSTTWNNLFSTIAPHLTNEALESKMESLITEMLIRNNREIILEIVNDGTYSDVDIDTCRIADHDFQTIKVQLKALGLIKQSNKSRSVKNAGNYWTLTDYGDYMMTQLIAIKKDLPNFLGIIQKKQLHNNL